MDGCRSMAHWLHWRCGYALRTAREKVRVAHALAELPAVHAAFARGELSYAKVRALTRIGNPENESLLMNWARYGTAAHLEKLVGGYLRYGETAPAADPGVRRAFTRYEAGDGRVTLRFELPPEEAALVLRALEAAEAELRLLEEEDENGSAEPAAPGEVRDDEERNGYEASSCREADRGGVAEGDFGNGSAEPASAAESSLADEVPTLSEAEWDAWYEAKTVRMAVEAVRAADTDMRHGSAEPHSPPGPRHDRRKADALVFLASRHLDGGGAPRAIAEKFQVHVQLECRDGEYPPCCEPGAPALAEESVRRLGCEAALVGVVQDGEGEILDVGRRTRAVPTAMRRALRLRDGGCRFPGCTQRRWVDAHHVVHWQDGGETKLSNLVELCRHHHRRVHEGAFGLARADDGPLVFTDAEGRCIPDAPAAPRLPADPVEALCQDQETLAMTKTPAVATGTRPRPTTAPPSPGSTTGRAGRRTRSGRDKSATWPPCQAVVDDPPAQSTEYNVAHRDGSPVESLG